MLLVHVPRLTNRLGYTLNVLLRTILNIDYQITTSKELFLNHHGPRFSYGGDAPLADEPFFRAEKILFETSIAPHDVQHLMVGDTHAIFPVEQPSALPFDPFAASFFMLSRYEEYLPFLPDVHGRFPAEQSLAFRYGFLTQAVVDRWALMVSDILVKSYPELESPQPSARFQVTVDIDAAYCYRHKGILRTCRGFLRDAFIAHDINAVKRRFRVIIGKEQDPFDTFDYILDHTNQHPSIIKPVFFILLGDYSIYDKPIPHTNRQQRQLLQHLCDYTKPGIHPSYYSFENTAEIAKETQRLAAILHRHIGRSRFHFLRLKFPQSFHALIDANILHDYSLGYPEEPGFRCGTGTPYPFFDLSTNQELPLKLHPFAIMDTTLSRYKKLDASGIEAIYQQLIAETRRNGGVLSTLWHNQNLEDSPLCAHNRQMFEMFVKQE